MKTYHYKKITDYSVGNYLTGEAYEVIENGKVYACELDIIAALGWARYIRIDN